MSLFNHCDRRSVRRSRPSILALSRAAVLAMLLARVSASPAQRVGTTPPVNNPGARSWVHESWTVKDGLPVNSINSLLQDRTGYIWASTFDGLVRFDGLRFTVFNSANSEELPSNRIILLKEGRDGALWLTTEQGHIVRFRDGRFTNIPFEKSSPSVGLTTLFVDSLGAVWAGNPGGLWTIHRDTLVRVGKGTIDVRVASIIQQRDGGVWVGTANGGIFRVSRDGRVTKVATDPAVESDIVGRMFEDASGTLWIAGDHALWSWRGGAVRVRGPPSPFFVEDFAQLSTGPILVASADGVYRIASDSATLVHPPARNPGKLL